jgi:hypothetical protein
MLQEKISQRHCRDDRTCHRPSRFADDSNLASAFSRSPKPPLRGETPRELLEAIA